jgi:predicted kinase
MRTIVMTIGLPASGKSTYSKELVKKEPGRWKRVSKDDLREMFDCYEFTQSNEKFVASVQDALIRSALKEGKDVVIDNTHLNGQSRRKIHEIAKAIGDVKVIEKAFRVDMQECIRRNEIRTTRKVPPGVIEGFHKAFGTFLAKVPDSKEYYYPPLALANGTRLGPVKQDPTLPKAIMCDLDGTLAIISGRSPYDASDCDVKDKPNWPVINAVLAMQAQGYKIIFMSGRDAKYRPETQRFIEKYCRVVSDKENEFAKPIPYELHMRGDLNPNPEKADMRKDNIIKRELFDAFVAGKYYIDFVLDDRNQVVEGWREMGLTCFQVAPGSF